MVLMHREVGTVIVPNTKFVCYMNIKYFTPSIVPKVVEKYRGPWKIPWKAELARQAM